MASRHLSRALVLQTLFECDMTGALTVDAADLVLKRNADEFSLGDSDLQFARNLLLGVLGKRDEVDEIIGKAAPQWPIEKIAPVDRNVLRIGLFELLFGDRNTVPPKVALNEAIEIAKSFGGDASGKFVNGVLGAVYRDIGEPQKNDVPKKETVPTETLGGVVVVSFTEGVAHVALVHDAFHHWTLPKTRCKEGEITRTAAERAALQELGVSVSVTDALEEHTYTAHEPGRGAVERTVAYFLAPLSTPVDIMCQVCEGITDARWFAEDRVAALPIYEDLRPIIDAAIARVKNT